MKQIIRSRAGRGLALTAAVGATLAMTTIGTAQAAAPETLTLCSEGSFASWAEFPERGGLATAEIASGECWDFEVRGDKAEQVLIYKSGDAEPIGATTYDPATGLGIATIDTPNGPDIKPI